MMMKVQSQAYSVVSFLPLRRQNASDAELRGRSSSVTGVNTRWDRELADATEGMEMFHLQMSLKFIGAYLQTISELLTLSNALINIKYTTSDQI